MRGREGSLFFSFSLLQHSSISSMVGRIFLVAVGATTKDTASRN